MSGDDMRVEVRVETIRADELKAVRWKNGGGVTREIDPLGLEQGDAVVIDVVPARVLDVAPVASGSALLDARIIPTQGNHA